MANSMISGSADSSKELDSFLSRSFLDLEKIDENLFRSKELWKHRQARSVYGGQVLGQALVAASLGVPETQHIHSLHSYFLLGGNAEIPILYHVDKTRDGRTYCSRAVKAVQTGKAIFTMQASFKQKESLRTTHQLEMPKVPQPDELKTSMEILDFLRDNELMSEEHYKIGLEWYEGFPVVQKWVDPTSFLMHRRSYPKRSLWFKARGHIGEDQHENIHKCCLAYMSDSFILQTALLPLAPFTNKPRPFITSLDHSMWFHAPCRADEWLLYEIESEYTGDGRALCHGRIWDINGTLVTTVAQEGVMRDIEAKSKL